MTYCAAWSHGRAAYIVSDTLRTYDFPFRIGRTSFNESRPDHRSEESILKVFHICDGVACAVAGDLRQAFVVVDFIAENFGHFNSIADLFDVLVNSTGPYRSDNHVAVVIAGSEKSAPAWVARWDSAHPARVDHGGSIYAIGSLNDSHKAMTEVLISQTSSKSPDTASPLLAIIAAVQSYGQHDNIIAECVGGAVCGLRVEGGSTYWQDDTVTVLYDDTNLDAAAISTQFREGVLFIRSPYLPKNQGSILINRQKWATEVAEVKARWVTDNGAIRAFGSSKNWIFLHRARRVATVACAYGDVETAKKKFLISAPDQNVLQATQFLNEILLRSVDVTAGAPGSVDVAVIIEKC